MLYRLAGFLHMKRIALPFNHTSVPLLAAIIALAAGCSGESEIKTYRVAKDEHSNPAAAVMAADPASGPARSALPHLHWDLPKGWEELAAGEMRTAAFQVPGEGGRTAQVTIIPLPGVSNKELESVNMWREQMGLDALTSEQMTAQSESVQVGPVKGQLFDFSSTAPKEGQKFKSRMLGVIANRENVLWFIKMIGDDTLVTEQKPAFTAFLKSLQFDDAPHMAAAERPVSTNTKKLPESDRSPNWKVPAHWQEKAPGPMILSAYNVTGGAGAAEVTISKFPGDVGGMTANVNRWRGQLGLAPLGDGEMGSAVKSLEVGGKKDAYLVDFKGRNARTGKDARLVAAAVPRGGETWFFKLLGDEGVVEKEKDTFLQFIQSAY